jgi:threonine/homoserine/homoserine lactone efflux protein
VTGVLMTLLNPMTLAFWFVVIPGYVRMSSENPGHDLPFICAGVFGGALGWVVFFCGVLSILGRFRRGWWLVAADVAGGSLLLAFAGLAFLRSIRRFL